MSTPEPPAEQPTPTGTPHVVYVPVAPRGLPGPAWFGIGFASAVGLGFVAMLGLFALSAFAFSGLDDFDDADIEYEVAQERVIDATDAPCTAMVTAGDAITAQAPASVAERRLREFGSSARDVAKAVDSADPNRDARAWRDDLRRLADAIDTFADGVRAGKDAPLAIPVRDDVPITEPMYEGSPDGCEVPITVEALDPDTLAYLYE